MTAAEHESLAESDRERLEAEVARRRAQDAADLASAGLAPDVMSQLTRNPAFAAAVARVTADPGAVDRQFSELDRVSLADLDRARRGNRWARYVSNRPPEFADACYAGLKDQQDPDRKVSRWWASGHQTLLMVGPARKGKSWGGYAVTNEVAQADREGGPGGRAVSVRAWSMIELLAALDWPAAHQRRDETWSRERERVEDGVTGCDLLLLDDPGRERVDDRRREVLHRILDHRVHSGGALRTVITMNTGSKDSLRDDIVEKYGDPVYGRMKHQAVAAWVDGVDLSGLVGWDPFK